MRRLEGKVALITGGAGGIGSATVERFVAEGCKVMIADLDGGAAQALSDRIGAQTLAQVLDIGDEDSFRTAIATLVERWGTIDILFNNAALTGKETQTDDTNAVTVTNEIWERTLHVNVTGYLYGCRHAIPVMAAAGGGVIINTASNSGLLGDMSRLAYGTSKAAVMSMTRYIATQHGREKIRCNAIAPGPIVTPNARAIAAVELGFLERQMPMGELGEPDDVAALAAYLASAESRYINGQVICIDGGMTMHHPHVMDVLDYRDRMAGKA